MNENLALRYRSLWLALGYGLALAVLVLSLLPIQKLPSVPTWDKLNHFIAYASLMAWFAQLFPHRRVVVAIACVAFGVMIEILQPIVSNRYFEYGDIAANAMGAALGWLAMRTPLRNAIAWIDSRLP